MENQHRKITGYRDLSQAEIDLMNEIKAKGAEVEALIAKLQQLQAREYDALSMAYKNPETSTPTDRGEQFKTLSTSINWRVDAAKDIQVGFMKLIRSVARPTTFC